MEKWSFPEHPSSLEAEAGSDGPWDLRPSREVFTEARDPLAMRHCRMTVRWATR